MYPLMSFFYAIIAWNSESIRVQFVIIATTIVFLIAIITSVVIAICNALLSSIY